MRETIVSGATFALFRSRYRPCEVHARHRDAHSRISLLLRGSVVESSGTGTVRLATGDVLLKTRDVQHEDVFGNQGAVILTFEFHDEDPFAACASAGLWRRRSDGPAFRHAARFLEAALARDGHGALTTAMDIVSSSVDGGPRVRKPPRWLADLKCELEDVSLAAVSVASRARSAGVHPAHASRLFRRCYGYSISEHAQAQCVRRAIDGLAQLDLPLREVALAAGFYDQSHMTRAFRRVIGRTPGAHRALLAAAG